MGSARGDELAWLREDQTRNVTYRGERTFHGLRCHVVSIACVIVERSEEFSRWELWLAEDRNYIPVRRLDFRYIISKNLPEGEGEVDGFREIEAGVWFPSSARAVGYRPLVLQEKGAQQLDWERRYSVEEVSLHPQYPPEYFSDVAFPDGTAVYEVSGGRITRSYRQGSPETAVPQGALPSRSSVLIVNVALLVVAMGFVFWRSRRASQKRATDTAAQIGG